MPPHLKPRMEKPVEDLILFCWGFCFVLVWFFVLFGLWGFCCGCLFVSLFVFYEGAICSGSFASLYAINFVILSNSSKRLF